jgi:hypothetical protein
MTDNARRTGPAVEAHFQFLMWLVPAVEKFPRTQNCPPVQRQHVSSRHPRTFSEATLSPPPCLPPALDVALLGGTRFGEFALFARPLLPVIKAGHFLGFRLPGSVASGDLLWSAGRCWDRVARRDAHHRPPWWPRRDDVPGLSRKLQSFTI